MLHNMCKNISRGLLNHSSSNSLLFQVSRFSPEINSSWYRKATTTCTFVRIWYCLFFNKCSYNGGEKFI